MSHLKTDWLCVATEGDTVDGRVIKRQWIIDMGETYDYTIDLLAELAQQCANHSHPTVGTPTNAAAFTLTATKAGQTRSKYQNIIA